MKFFSRITLIVGILIGMAGQSGTYSKENVVRPATEGELQKFDRGLPEAMNKEKTEILETLEWNRYAIGFTKVYLLFLVSVLGVVFWRSSGVADFQRKRPSMPGLFRILEKLKLTPYEDLLSRWSVSDIIASIKTLVNSRFSRYSRIQ